MRFQPLRCFLVLEQVVARLGRLFRQAHGQTIRQPHVDSGDVAREKARLLVHLGQGRQRFLDLEFGQTHINPVRQTEIQRRSPTKTIAFTWSAPADIAPAGEEIPGAGFSTLAHHQRQRHESPRRIRLQHRAVGRNHGHTAILLPKSERRPLGNVDLQLARIELLHRCIGNPRIGLQLVARRGRIEKQQRRAPVDAADRQNFILRELLAPVMATLVMRKPIALAAALRVSLGLRERRRYVRPS
jgi:hypothetical protein